MNHLQHLIANHAHPDELAAWLDRLSHAARLDEVMALQRNDQRALFQRVQGAHPLDLQHYVPASTPDLHEVIHWGRNTLPAFNFFQKRFCRPPAAQVQHQPVLWGYNEQTMKALTGPGYFHARPGDQDTPVWIDYRGLPPRAAPRAGRARSTTDSASAASSTTAPWTACAASPSTSPSAPPSAASAP